MNPIEEELKRFDDLIERIDRRTNEILRLLGIEEEKRNERQDVSQT